LPSNNYVAFYKNMHPWANAQKVAVPLIGQSDRKIHVDNAIFWVVYFQLRYQQFVFNCTAILLLLFIFPTASKTFMALWDDILLPVDTSPCPVLSATMSHFFPSGNNV
jgi:hypothetical protein